MDLSKVTNIDDRKRWAELNRKRDALEDRCDKIKTPMFAEIEEARKKHHQAWDAIEDEIVARHTAAHDLKSIAADRTALEAEMDALDLDVCWDEEGRSLTCALTDLPILNSDEVLTDEETGERFLRAALPVPPRERDEPASDDVEAAA